MRSKEVADIAGVSVRTLRHYHRLGILPEPARGTNGYRAYQMSHVTRLLRIRRLAGLGFSLERIGEILADEGTRDAAEELTALDRELEARVAALERQRKLIAELMAEGAAPDAPAGHARFLAALRKTAASPFLIALERDVRFLAEATASEESKRALGEFQRIMLETGTIDRYAAVSERILSVCPSTPAAEREHVIAEAVDFLEPLIERVDERFDAGSGWSTDTDEAGLSAQLAFDREVFTADHLSFVGEIEAAIVRRLAERCPDRGIDVEDAGAQPLDPDATS